MHARVVEPRCGSGAALKAAVLAVLALGACAPAPASQEGAAPLYEATVRWTSYGIPHVQADDWGGLGYGLAHAVAEDAFCVLTHEAVTVSGDLSRWFGPQDGNVESDAFHRAVLDEETVESYLAAQGPEVTALWDGYVAGHDDWLAARRDELPSSCADAEWVRPLTGEDLARMIIKVGMFNGLAGAVEPVAEAEPPAASNAYAFGGAATENGRGLLLGNPHFPWHGPLRFHIRHLTIPGELDVMGASLYTTPIVAIGFTRHLAWTHTVSTAQRFTLYRLELVEGDPHAYRYGEEVRRLEPREVTIPVRGEDGELREERRTVWFSHHGPVLESERYPWTERHAFAIRDANLRNDRLLETFRRVARDTSVRALASTLQDFQGLPFINTLAADRLGEALYADIGAVPNVDEALIQRCGVEREPDVPPRPGVGEVGVLDGSDPTCEWPTEPDAAAEGLMPPGEMPWLVRDDYVTNSNDSHWISNPEAPLEGYSPVIGDERTPRSLRTRAGLVFIDEVLGRGEKMTPARVREILFSHRNYGAELLLDDVLAICEAGPTTVPLEDAAVDVAEACAVLADWDRAHTVGSRGAHVWTELWRTARRFDGLWAVRFDPDRPVETPRGIRTDDPEVRADVLHALAMAVQRLREAEIPLDAALGEVQYVMRNEEKIPIPGGEGWAGAFSMTVAPLRPGEGYTPVVHGNSYIQVVTWDAAGDPEVWALLTYSQSQEPESPHYADQTRLYSRGEWLRLPFTEDEIAADPNLRTVRVSGGGG